MRTTITAIITATLALLLAGCGSNDPEPQQPEPVDQFEQSLSMAIEGLSDEDLTAFCEEVDAAGDDAIDIMREGFESSTDSVAWDDDTAQMVVDEICGVWLD